MRAFVTADMHLGHENIIEYENRPYRDVNHMNEDLIKRWNSVVGDDDVVYHLGDFASGGGARQKIDEWVSRLRGYKIWISGNHDDPKPSMDAAILNTYGFTFVMVHNTSTMAITASAYDSNTMWTLHGHAHRHRPLIDVEKRSSCVSVENINFTPLLISTLVDQIKKATKEAGW